MPSFTGKVSVKKNMVEPGKEEWLELHTTFREYCAAEPWQWLEEAVVVLDHPIWHERAYCVALGSSGLEFGLAFTLATRV